MFQRWIEDALIRRTRWERILALLDWSAGARPPQRAPWAKACPCCGKPMQRLGVLPRQPCRPP